MDRHATRLIKAALLAAYASGADRLIAPFTQGLGVIFMLHHVRPEPPAAFEPNRILTVTPDFLDAVLGFVRAADLDVVALDEVPGRLAAGGGRRFCAFTLDDGYKDNLAHAYPVFRRHGAPFTVYVATDYVDGHGDLWWLVLEKAIGRAERALVATIGGVERVFPTATVEEKHAAYQALYWPLRRGAEDVARATVAGLAAQAGYDASGLCRDLVMTWDDVRALAADPLVTIGTHTRRHYALGKLDAAAAEAEMAESIARVAAETGCECRHFAYPYGCEVSAGPREFETARQLGLMTAVTTRKGHLTRTHAAELTALPRLSLNGDYQDVRYTRVLMSGAPFALLNGLGRLRRPAAYGGAGPTGGTST